MGRRTLVAVLVPTLAAALVVGGREAGGTADGPDRYAVTGIDAGDTLDIRAEPSACASKIGAVPADGRGIENLGCRGGPTFSQWQEMSETERWQAALDRWCRVRFGGVEGWVAGRHLKEDTGPE